MTRDPERDRLALEVLARAMYRGGDFWLFGDLDGGEQQDAMAAAGLLDRVSYNPEVHGHHVEADRGEEIFVLSDYGREILGVKK